MSCSSATCSRPSSAAFSPMAVARSRACCGGSISCRGGPSGSRGISSTARRARLRSPASSTIAPALIYEGRRTLVRSWIEALPLHIAQARRRSRLISAPPRRRLRALHRHKRHAQRSRQGAELAAHARRPLHADRFPARHALLPPPRPVPARGLRGSAASAQTQAPLRARKPDRQREAHSGAQEPADAHLDGDRKARLLLRSRAAFSISPTAKAAARASSTTRRCSPRG